MKEMDSQSKTSLKLQAYQYLKTKILNCEYRPNEFLNEQKLCAEMGNISRTPMRDALGRLEQEGLVIFGAQIGRREDLPGEGKIRVVIGPGELFPGAQPHLHGGGGVPPDENGGPVVDAPHAIQIQPMEGEDQAWGLSLDWSRGRLPPTGRKRSAGEKEGQDQGSRPPGRAGTGRGERFRQSAHGRYLFSNFLMSKAGPQKRPSDWEGTRTSSPRLL